MADNYVLYLDECGDQNLSSFDPQFPIFTLCGVVVSEEQDKLLADRINSLKMDIWNNTNIILHSRDIRKCQNGFEVLFDLEVKKHFLESVNAILGDDIYIIICCAILKEPYIRQYGKLNDVYGLSLSYIMERVVFYLDSVGKDNIELRTVIERRGKKEDKSLLNYYNQLLDRGTYWVNGKECVEPKWCKFGIRCLEKEYLSGGWQDVWHESLPKGEIKKSCRWQPFSDRGHPNPNKANFIWLQR